MQNTLLIVEDDNGLQKYLRELLLDKGYSVQGAFDGIQALGMIEKVIPDLVILDLGLPKMSGESVCAELRKKYPELKIIILTAKDNVNDVIHGLDMGADDYIKKPFQAEELLARIKANLRSMGNLAPKMVIGDLEMDTKTMEVRRKGKLIQLTPKEFKLLQYLMNNKGRILTREMILNRIWLYCPDIETRVVDVYMGYIRKKIDSDSKKKLLHSIRGFGYMIRE